MCVYALAKHIQQMNFLVAMYMHKRSSETKQWAKMTSLKDALFILRVAVDAQN